MAPENTLIFVDGENLAIRYKEMLALGHVPRPDNIYIEDCFVWNQRVLDEQIWMIKRLSYYTSLAGDDVLIRSVREQIAATTFRCKVDLSPQGNATKTGQIIPFVRKKTAKTRKESICDIAIAVDVMRACYRDHAETIWIFSGDGDFIQLFSEVVHSGKCAYASAFSVGMNSELRFVVDEFIPLDKHFFLSPEEIQAKAAQKTAVATRVQSATRSLPPATADA